MSTPSTAVEERLITGEELFEMGDIGRSELIDGRIVFMSPTGGEHAYLEVALSSRLDNFMRARKLGWVLAGEVGFYIRRNPDRIRAPDVAFVSRQRMPRRPRKNFLEVTPELVVEIVSPSDEWAEIRRKIADYFSIGVNRVWLVEPDEQDILVFQSPTEFTRFGIGESLKGEGVLKGFELVVSELFEE